MNEYAIVIEDAGANLAAYVPDLPGCIGAADNIEEIEVLMRDAIEFHIEECCSTAKKCRHLPRVCLRYALLRELDLHPAIDLVQQRRSKTASPTRWAIIGRSVAGL